MSHTFTQLAGGSAEDRGREVEELILSQFEKRIKPLCVM